MQTILAKYFEQRKEIEQKWAEVESFNNYFCVILVVITKVLFLNGRMGVRLYFHLSLTFI